MSEWTSFDLGPYDVGNTDQQKIENQMWVPCRICWTVFARVRLTARYCNQCLQGFCDGEHGNMPGGSGICLVCNPLLTGEQEEEGIVSPDA
jgi:hypothetical protein